MLLVLFPLPVVFRAIGVVVHALAMCLTEPNLFPVLSTSQYCEDEH